MLFGYIFWLVMSKITTPDIIGISSAVISIGSIVASIANIGVPIGIQRFLGKSIYEQQLGDVKVFVNTSLIITFIGIAICSAMILVAYNWFHFAFRIDFVMMIVTILLIGSSTIMTLLRSIVISSLNTKMLPLIMVLSVMVKIILGAILVWGGTGAFGVTVGFTLFPVISSVLLIITILKIYKSLPDRRQEIRYLKSFKEIMIASGASWIPYVIHTAGAYLGPLLVFGSVGSSQAGIYFIAYSLFTAISTFSSVLFTIAYPVLSAMQDGRKKFAWKITKISLILSIPLASAVIFYSKDIMQLIGHNYVGGSSSLEILLISMLPIGIMTGINTLMNSYGNYRSVLAIGIATNIPTAVLYFILLPIYNNSVGAAISYTAGSIIGCIFSIIIAKKIRMHLFWKEITIIMALPNAFAFVFSYFQINFIIGILITLAATYIILLQLKIMTREDIKDFLSIVPYHSNILVIIFNIWKKFYKKTS